MRKEIISDHTHEKSHTGSSQQKCRPFDRERRAPRTIYLARYSADRRNRVVSPLVYSLPFFGAVWHSACFNQSTGRSIVRVVQVGEGEGGIGSHGHGRPGTGGLGMRPNCYSFVPERHIREPNQFQFRMFRCSAVPPPFSPSRRFFDKRRSQYYFLPTYNTINPCTRNCTLQ